MALYTRSWLYLVPFFILLVVRLTLAQTNNSLAINSSSIVDVTCPSDNECFSSYRAVTVTWTYDGHVCHGQTDGQCYKGEKDPRGFIRGPVLNPVQINLGDTLFFQALGFSIKPFTVSRGSFYSCTFNDADAVIPSLSSVKFEVPNKFISSEGVKYFIAKSNNTLFNCRFGLRLEVFVRNTNPCLNTSVQGNDICSKKGLCAVAGSFFNYTLSCVCQAGYVGSYCEELNSCHNNPCVNGGTCLDKQSGLANDYECKCIKGYSGKNCQTNIDDCKDKPCERGLCLDGIGEYTCLCPPGYNGKNCSELKPNPCEPNPCENGGTCSLDEHRHNYTCKCPDAFEGKNCSHNATLKSSVATSSSTMVTSYASTSSSVMASSQAVSSNSFASTFSSLKTSTVSSWVLASSSSVSSSLLKPTTTIIPMSMSSQSYPLSKLSTKTVQHTLTVATSSLTTAASLTSDVTAVPGSTSVVAHTTVVQSTRSTPHVSTGTQMSISSTTAMMTSIPLSTTTPSSQPVATTVSQASTPLLTATRSSLEGTRTATMILSESIPLSSTMTPITWSSPSVTATVALSTSTIFSTVPVNSSVVPGIQSTLSMETSTSALASPSTTHMSSNTMAPVSTRLSSSMVSTSYNVSPTPATSTVSSSTVVPTTVPPTTVPLRERTCQDKPCNTGTCLDKPDSIGFNFTCVCPKPTYGPRCSTDFKLHFPRFGNGSYLVHKPIGKFIGFSKILISFKTTASDGLLFYSTHRTYKDFIQLFVIDGYLEFRFDPGDGLVGIQSDTKVNTGKIVTAVLTYESSKREGTLVVDKNNAKKRSSNGKQKGIDLFNDLYIGGLPPGKKIGLNDEAKETSTFDGCIKDMEINNRGIKFTSPDATDWNNLNECDKPCDHHPCHNNGNCTNDLEDPHDFQCKCPTGYVGKKCDTYRICSGDPCKGGMCIANAADGSKKCLCPFGRAGINCENDVNITIPCFSIAYNHSSYIQYQTPEDSGPYFALSLQFQIDSTSTAMKNSLLAFSGQANYQDSGDDYIALGIINNQVVLEYNLGSGIARITSNNLDENLEWHSVMAGRDKQSGFLFLDSQSPSPKRGRSPGSYSGLNLYGPLYIGGVPDFPDLGDIQFKSGFQGCISNVKVKFGENKQFINLLTTQSGINGWPVAAGRNVADKNSTACDKNTCKNNGTCVTQGNIPACTCVDGWKGTFCSSRVIPCVNHNPCASQSTCREVNNKTVCDCPLGKTGQTCSQSLSIQTPRFNENSYMSFDPTKLSSQSYYLIKKTTSIKITFTPSNANGLLFYVTKDITSQQLDFLSISLHNRFVHYRYNLGTGMAKLQSKNALSLNTSHTVEVTRNGKSGTLKVDNETAVSGQSPSTALGLDVKSDYYLGGVPQLSAVNPMAVLDSSSLKDYVGCVSLLTVNKVSLVLTEKGAKEGRNIDNCPQSKKA